MRFDSMQGLRKYLSPDVEIMDDNQPPSDLNKLLAKEDARARREILEKRFQVIWNDLGGKPLEAQVKFHPERKWRFDFADRVTMVAFEIQGGIYRAQSGHRSFEGVQRDYEKLNAATIWGWKVIQVTSPMMDDLAYMQELVDFVDNL